MTNSKVSFDIDNDIDEISENYMGQFKMME